MKCIRCKDKFKHPSVMNVCNTSFHKFRWGNLNITIEPQNYTYDALLCYNCIKEINKKISDALFEDKA